MTRCLAEAGGSRAAECHVAMIPPTRLSDLLNAMPHQYPSEDLMHSPNSQKKPSHNSHMPTSTSLATAPTDAWLGTAITRIEADFDAEMSAGQTAQ